jgi:hypothetical protein
MRRPFMRWLGAALFRWVATDLNETLVAPA